MRPRPSAAGFQRCRPGSVSRSAKLGSSAIASRDILRAMPLAVTDVTHSRREILIVPRLSLPETELWTRYSGSAFGTAPFVCTGVHLRMCERRYGEFGHQGRSASVFAPGPGVIKVGHWREPNGTCGGNVG